MRKVACEDEVGTNHEIICAATVLSGLAWQRLSRNAVNAAQRDAPFPDSFRASNASCNIRRSEEEELAIFTLHETLRKPTKRRRRREKFWLFLLHSAHDYPGRRSPAQCCQWKN